MENNMWLRLRQIALVAAELAPVEAELIDVLGIKVCYRDPGVAAEISPAVTYPVSAFQSYIPAVGDARYEKTFAARSLIEAGARLGYGSVWLTLIPPSP